MKKIMLLCAAIIAFGMAAYAQLGKPTTTVKDTFYINHTYYSGMKLNRADWPDTMIVEDALKVYVAKSTYTKEELKFTFSGRKYETLCNGKKYEIFFGDDNEYVEIGGYRFYIERKNEPKETMSSSNYALSSRTALSIPAPQYNSNSQGKVVIKVWVDRDGKVIRAEFNPKGSTTSDAKLIQASRDAALKARFNSDINAPEEQVGSLTYLFKVQ